MSRRESRSSMNARQNDALFEFENFKKRFLVVNKQITKLNSSMSVRIEELNAQISSLYTENLRLRASEIALETQLKREREKSTKTLAEMEAVLVRQLNHLRHTLDLPAGWDKPAEPYMPRAQQRPTVDPNTRLSRQPTIPDIIEHDDEGEDVPKRYKTKRLSASKLPLPSRALSPSPVPSPTPPTPMQMEVGMGSTNSRRKSSRRQSGLVDVDDRPPSPAFGSPISKGPMLLDDEDEGVVVEDEVEMIDDYRPVMSRKEGKRLKDVTNHSSPPREFLGHRSPSPPQLPTPRHSSSPTTPPPDPDPDLVEPSGRERRTRRSVNYAEPKLNTKMRKPDGYANSTKKRSSQSSSRNEFEDEDEPVRSRSAEMPVTKKRPPSNAVYRSDIETDEDPARSSTDVPTASSSRTSLPSSSSSSEAAPKRKRNTAAKVYDFDLDEADDADGECVPNRWVNEGRRRGTSTQPKNGDRRHSSAV